MDEVRRLERAFRGSAVRRVGEDGEFYLTVEDAVRMCDEARVHNLAVIGVEGLRFDPADGSVEPSVAWIFDAAREGVERAGSWSSFCDECSKQAIEHVRMYGADGANVFSIVLRSEARDRAIRAEDEGRRRGEGTG